MHYTQSACETLADRRDRLATELLTVERALVRVEALRAEYEAEFMRRGRDEIAVLVGEQPASER